MYKQVISDRKREAALWLQYPTNQLSNSHKGLFKISLPGLCIPVRQSHVLSALDTEKRVSPELSLVTELPGFGEL